MNSPQAVESFAALAHEYRLAICGMLFEAGPKGLNAGAVAARLKLPASSLSFHLQQLLRAGLITRKRQGRELIYAVDFARMNGVIRYLMEECLGGVTSGSATGSEPLDETKRIRKSSQAA